MVVTVSRLGFTRENELRLISLLYLIVVFIDLELLMTVNHLGLCCWLDFSLLIASLLFGLERPSRLGVVAKPLSGTFYQ